MSMEITAAMYQVTQVPAQKAAARQKQIVRQVHRQPARPRKNI